MLRRFIVWPEPYITDNLFIFFKACIVVAGLKSCEHELYCGYFIMILANVLRISKCECLMDSFFTEAEII